MKKIRDLKKLSEKAGLLISDKVSAFVGTWTFVFIYTASMFLWMALHWLGYLHIDSQDFIKWNLWLSYFAGTQASIVLMSATRQANADRKAQELAYRLEQRTNKIAIGNSQKVETIIQQVKTLESILEDMVMEVKPKDKR